MFLKEINVYGFKSFGEKTSIKFDNLFSVIVGPNGSGKSNISDAINWVLGELSNKKLRVPGKTDVIFSGTDKYQKANYAEVELLFDNTNHYLNNESKCVSVKRKLIRKDEENIYFLNNDVVKRKDIKDLFINTGLGKSNLSMIGQGSIKKIVQAKPSELKEFFEESIGISKYKIEKKSSLSKLEKVDINLDLLTVKLDELNKRIKPLKKQKEKADHYLKIKDKLKEIELPIIKTFFIKENFKTNELNDSLNEFSRIRDKSSDQLELLTDEVKTNNQKILILEKSLEKLQRLESENKKTQVDLSNGVDFKTDLTNKITDYKSRIRSLKTILEDTNSLITEKKNNLYSVTDRLESLQRKKEAYSFELIELETSFKFAKSDKANQEKGTIVVLENINIFEGIHGLVKNLIKYDDKYNLAVSKSIGSQLNNLVTRDNDCASKIIKFLRENKYGSTTIVPLDNVKVNSIDDYELKALSTLDGYQGVLSDFLNATPNYYKLKMFLGSKTLLFDNIRNATNAFNSMTRKIKIVTLDGDVIYPNSIIKGGYNAGALDSEKHASDKIDFAKNNIERLNNEIKETQFKQQQLRTELSNEEYNSVRTEEKLDLYELELTTLLNTYSKNFGEFDSDESNVDDSYSMSIEKISTDIKKINKEKQSLIVRNTDIESLREDLRISWQQAVNSITKIRSELSSLSDSYSIYLNKLNKDYMMTIEALKSDESTETKETISENDRKLIKELNHELRQLGNVSLETIEEYVELEEEWNELNNNVMDITNTKKSILSTIKILDDEMKKALNENFPLANKMFNDTFNKIFGGGSAEIILEDPRDILESGMDLRVKIPNKIIRNIKMFSGGEQSLISLAFIFSLVKINDLPLIFMDEAEAELDEQNVEKFSSFCKELNKENQIIVATHRQTTMQKADVLFGVTMPTTSPGITKIFKIDISEAKKLLEDDK